MTDLDITAVTPMDMEKLIDRLRSKANVGAGRGNLFSISFEDTDPQRARDVVQALITIFVEFLGQPGSEQIRAGFGAALSRSANRRV